MSASVAAREDDMAGMGATNGEERQKAFEVVSKEERPSALSRNFYIALSTILCAWFAALVQR